MDECAVCFEPVADDEPGTHALGCGHRFHVECILGWAQSSADAHGTCPVCRFDAGAGLSHEQEQTSLHWRCYSTETEFVRMLRHLDACLHSFRPEERELYGALRAEYERARALWGAARDARAEHRRAHAAAIRRNGDLQRRYWRTGSALSVARRNVLALFPVTTVAVVRGGERAAPVRRVLRRSARVSAAHAGAGAAGAGGGAEP